MVEKEINHEINHEINQPYSSSINEATSSSATYHFPMYKGSATFDKMKKRPCGQ